MKNLTNVAMYNPAPALRRFACAITILNIAGHFYLGFEQSWAYPLAALGTTYLLEFLFELVYSRLNNKKPRYAGGWSKTVDFFLPAHITGMATSMLLFANENLYPIVFASAVAICSKILFRVNINARSRHFLNPSNTGIAITLMLFPAVGISPPYQFTENLYGFGDWVLPGILVLAGTFLNYKFTGRITLVVAWVAAFFLQGLMRSLYFDVSLGSVLLPITGVAFLLFTFYMISDPATTPQSRNGQIAFAFSVAFIYGLLTVCHVVFGLFFALIITCVLRGGWIAAAAYVLPRYNTRRVESEVLAG